MVDLNQWNRSWYIIKDILKVNNWLYTPCAFNKIDRKRKQYCIKY